MRNTMIVACLVISTAMGCSRTAIPENIGAQMDEVTMAVVKPGEWQEKADAIFADIAKLPDKQLKIVCLQKFVEKALAIDLSSPGMKNPRWTASYVVDLCYCICGQVKMSGGNVEDVWDVVLIPLFSWMRTQAEKLYGDGKLPKGTTRLNSGSLLTHDHEAWRQYAKRRDAYGMIAAAYDNRLNCAEARFPNHWNGMVDEIKIDENRISALKNRIEIFLGRPMRTPEQCRKDWENKKYEMRPWPR